MNFAFVFPGQGSQSVGMLMPFAGLRVVEDTLDEASQWLDFNIGNLISAGPADELNRTTNTQPAMLAADVACYRVWRAAGGAEPQAAAGHSLGEYAALVAAGVLPFGEALRLVRFRAQTMQEAVPAGAGAMAAILGLAPEQVLAACVTAAEGDVVEAVNFNEPLQTVIAGHTPAVARACAAAKELGARRVIALAVSAPFHSSLMKPAAARLAEYLAALTFSVPKFDVILNVDARSTDDPNVIREALVRQAWRPVRWVESIQVMSAQGVTCVVECGPGNVLGGLVKRIDRELTTFSVNDPLSLARTLEGVR